MSVHLDHIIRVSPQDGRPIVNDVSLTVEDGSFTALVGPSGAGKTSLLRVIAGLDGHQGGTVCIDGARVDTVNARDRNIGFVFQHYALFAHMTVAANIGFGLRIRPRRSRPGRAEIERRVADLLDLMQLSGMGSRYPHELSGGQRQRVALARALATEPRVLLLDEPFGALDPVVRRQIRGWLRDLHERLGLTTILVTHDRQEATELADTIALMRHGRVVQTGTAQQLEDMPADPFVMEFTGDVIRIPGRIDRGLFVADMPDIRAFAANAADGRGEVLIRPADIRLLPDAGSAMAWLRQTRGMIGTYDFTTGTQTLRFETVIPAGAAPIIVNCALDISAGRIAQGDVWIERQDTTVAQPATPQSTGP